LGSTNLSCAVVNVTKTFSPDTVSITSKGYNIGDSACASTNPNRVERELLANY
jgi:hypothetical protein